VQRTRTEYQLEGMSSNKRDAFGAGLRKPAAASPALKLSAEVGRSVIRFTDYENFYHGWGHGLLPCAAPSGLMNAKRSSSKSKDAYGLILDSEGERGKETKGESTRYLHRKFTTFPHAGNWSDSYPVGTHTETFNE
jgi:hypothetical protein